MRNKKIYFWFIAVIILGLLAGFFVYPASWNKLADLVNELGLFKTPKMEGRSFRLGLDLQGGTHLVYEADLSNIEKENYGEAMEGV